MPGQSSGVSAASSGVSGACVFIISARSMLVRMSVMVRPMAGLLVWSGRSEGGDGGADAGDDGVPHLLAGGDAGLAPPVPAVELAVSGVEPHLVDAAEQLVRLAVGDGLALPGGRADVAGVVVAGLQAGEGGPAVEVDAVVAVLGPALAADGGHGVHGEGDLLGGLADAEGDPLGEGGGLDDPPAADLGGGHGADPAPGADGGDGDVGLEGGGGGVHRASFLGRSP